jgi:hypothetical protein
MQVTQAAAYAVDPAEPALAALIIWVEAGGPSRLAAHVSDVV